MPERQKNRKRENRRPRREKREAKEFDKEAWKPKTELGRKVKSGEIKDIDEILDTGKVILEAEIVDVLLPGLENELLLVGQSKGKFGGGSRRIFRQTQKKTREGNKPKFATVAVVGNGNGYVGVGHGKSKETVPAREKSLRNAKLSIFKIKRGNGSWEDDSKEPHTIPYKVKGKCGAVRLTLIPAPKGTGLCIEKECGKILKLAGIENIWSKTKGKTTTKFNLVKACVDALSQLMIMKTKEQDIERLSIAEGAIKKEKPKMTEEEIKELAAIDVPKEIEEASKKEEKAPEVKKEEKKEKTEEPTSKKVEK